MAEPPSQATLVEAFATLFGSEARFYDDTLRYLQPDGLKAAYRAQVLQTHPDRAQVLGEEREVLAARFRKVVWAYQSLSQAISQHSLAARADRTEQRVGQSPGRGFSAGSYSGQHRYYHGQLPRRLLRLGEYLYYSGHISWQQFMAALTWQKAQRPMLGRIALAWKLIRRDQVAEVLKERRFGEKFGECAVRKGFLSRFWLRTILFHQSKSQRRLGEYFVDQGILSAGEINDLVEQMELHNQRIRYMN